ncbi:MAG: hypothetical protein AMXMBFR81_13740 [Chthonomonas sp.]
MRFVLGFLAFVGLALSLHGCGGGGGGGVQTSLVFEAAWVGAAGGVNGRSMRVSLLDSAGNLVGATALLNENPDGSSQAIAATPGSYRVLAELYSQLDLGGTKVGQIETLVELSGATRVRTAVGTPLASLRVTPSSAEVEAQFSRQFYAAGFDAAGRMAFTEPGSVAWTVLGTGATVGDDGRCIGEIPGTYTIRATHASSATQGAATLTVKPFVTKRTKWTVMVFLNAANDLYRFSTLNVNQMESVAQNPDVRFVLQWKQSTSRYPGSTFDGTRRYLVKPDTTSAIASQMMQDMGAVDMGRPETMQAFIRWCKTYFPADRYALVVWNHGNGWRRSAELGRAVSYDDETGNAIQIWELQQAMGGEQVDIFAWDASLMQMVEVATEVADQARYVVGSEESPPGEGYPYDRVFSVFRDNPDAATATLTKAFVDGMLAVPEYASRKITQSVVDTSRLQPLLVALDELAGTMIAHREALATDIPVVRGQTQAYSQTFARYFRDIGDLCDNLVGMTSVPEVRAAAATVRARLGEAILWEGHNAFSPRSNGLSIDVSPASTFESDAANYALMRFAQQTRWDEWLRQAP